MCRDKATRAAPTDRRFPCSLGRVMPLEQTIARAPCSVRTPLCSYRAYPNKGLLLCHDSLLYYLQTILGPQGTYYDKSYNPDSLTPLSQVISELYEDNSNGEK